jgi:DNA-binding winged helix-turn-helix (wHTH) protein
MSFERMQYRFGVFEVDVHSRSLLRQGRRVRLQEQPFQVLLALLEGRGDLVSRDQLRARLWPGDTFVEFDKSLGVALAKVRAALGDEAANPRFIETVPKRGYRFIAPITVVSGNGIVQPAPEPAVVFTPASPASSINTPALHARRRQRTAIAASVLVVIAGVSAFSFWRSRVNGRLTARAGVVVAAFTNTTG